MDNFNFSTISEFSGYISSKDRTNVAVNALIRGSQNVYKRRSGTLAPRFGLKRRGSADTTVAGVKSEFVYNTSNGAVRPLRVCNNKLQIESDVLVSGSYVWYDLLFTSTLLNPAVSLTRFVFESWWEAKEQKDRVLMVRGDSNVLHWSGGITKVSGGAKNSNDAVTAITISGAGSNYTVGDILLVDQGNGCTVRVDTVSAGAITAISLITPGVNLSTGIKNTINILTTSASATGATVNITAISSTTWWTITKSDTSTTWSQDGFADWNPSEHKIIINGVEYQYSSMIDGVLYGVTTDTTGISVDSIAIQSVFTESLVTEIPDDDFVADFIAIVKNHACYGSYTSKVIHISCIETIANELGFSNLGSGTNDQVPGDPDFAIIDEVARGMIVRKDRLYVSGGTSDWYEIEVDAKPPISIPFYHDLASGKSAYVITDIKKRKGSGLSALLAHEFACVVGDNIYYVSQDNQLRVVGTFTQIEGTNFPLISQAVYDELKEEDFSGGHIKSSEDYVYITAPISGRHWMYQIRENLDVSGQITAERLWHPPQVSGISRFSEIEGVLYGHSNTNPQLYQIWDTNQWHDDSPTDEEISYTSVARIAYWHTVNAKGGINRVALNRFDKVYYEGFLALGSPIYGKIYYDYKGATDIQNVEINTIAKPATFFLGGQVSGIGTDSLGANPLGDGVIEEANEQATLSKFRTICDVADKDSFEYELEVYSVDANSRWEILCLGTNSTPSDASPTFLRK